MTGTDRGEAMVKDTTGGLFRGLPRRGWVGTLVLAGWLGVAFAFVAGLAPSAEPVAWLYGVEARRDAHARAIQQRSEVRPVRAPSPIFATATPEW